MTIAISLKVNDGVVLASDSATTVVGRMPESPTPQILNIYNHANKIFNLRKGSPIGAITWGAGSIGPESISTLMKDLRKLMGTREQRWHIDWGKYSVSQVVNTVREFFIEKYQAGFSDWPEKPALGFIVAGYSTNSGMAEEYQIDFVNGECAEPRQLRPLPDSGLTWSGEPEAITRLVMGFGTQLRAVLQGNFGLTNEQLEPVMQIFQQSLQAQLVLAAMPIQDAIDLAEFLVEATIKFTRFKIGGPTVGGPIEIAAITKHEGFKWVYRKHYYNDTLNPKFDIRGGDDDVS